MEKVKTEREVAEAVLSKAKSMLDNFLKKKEDLDKMEGVDSKKYDSCVDQVKDSGKDESSAHAICHAALKKTEKLKNFLARKHIKRMASKVHKAPVKEGV